MFYGLNASLNKRRPVGFVNIDVNNLQKYAKVQWLHVLTLKCARARIVIKILRYFCFIGGSANPGAKRPGESLKYKWTQVQFSKYGTYTMGQISQEREGFLSEKRDLTAHNWQNCKR